MAKVKKRVATRKKALETWEGKRQAYAQEGGKARAAKKATTEDPGKNGTKKSAKTRRPGHRRHDY